MITYIILSIIVGTAIEFKIKLRTGESLFDMISCMVSFEQPNFSEDEILIASSFLHMMVYVLFPITAILLVR